MATLPALWLAAPSHRDGCGLLKGSEQPCQLDWPGIESQREQSQNQLSSIMGLIDVARDTLKEIPMADILRERLSLALDQSATFERQVGELQSKVGGVAAQLENERLNHQQTLMELQRLKDEHSEEIRIHSTIEFRRGKRTAGKWVAFCPKCHMPAANIDGEVWVRCTDSGCKWMATLNNMPLSLAIAELGQ